MVQKPILFAGPMILAHLQAIKTQTRRVLNPQPPSADFDQPCFYNPSVAACDGEYEPGLEVFGIPSADGDWGIKLPYAPDDVLWVKEIWCDVNAYGAPGIVYRADELTLDLMDREDFLEKDGSFNYHDERLTATQQRYSFCIWSADLIRGTTKGWRPSIFMPRWASRYTNQVCAVFVERLQDISEEDARAEGLYLNEAAGENGGYSVPGTDFCGKTAKDTFRQLWDSINAKPKAQYTTKDGARVISSYLSYPWEGESRTEEFRGKPHHVITNPYVCVVKFNSIHRNIDLIKSWELAA